MYGSPAMGPRQDQSKQGPGGQHPPAIKAHHAHGAVAAARLRRGAGSGRRGGGPLLLHVGRREGRQKVCHASGGPGVAAATGYGGGGGRATERGAVTAPRLGCCRQGRPRRRLWGATVRGGGLGSAREGPATRAAACGWARSVWCGRTGRQAHCCGGLFDVQRACRRGSGGLWAQGRQGLTRSGPLGPSRPTLLPRRSPTAPCDARKPPAFAATECGGQPGAARSSPWAVLGWSSVVKERN